MKARATVAVVIAASAVLAGVAFADTGDLTPLGLNGCIDDRQTGPEACIASARGLDVARSVAVTKDGKSVYVAGAGDDAIVEFERTTSGRLAADGCIDDNDTGADFCAQSTDGLDNTGYVAVSPDGKSVYATSFLDGAIVRFNRSTSTGELTPAGCIDDNEAFSAPDTCAVSTDGLADPHGIAVSADGKSVYVVSRGDDAIVHFKRNLTTGALTPVGCIDDNDPPDGPEPCAVSTDGLGGAGAVAVSADNKSVYVASKSDDAIVRFIRNTSTGALSPAGCIDDNDTGPDTCALSTDGMNTNVNGSVGIAISPDGKSVYGAFGDDDAIVRLRRDTATGGITPRSCTDDNDTGTDACAQSVDGLDGAAAVAVSADGKSVYVASADDDATVAFERGSFGGLAPIGCVDDNDVGLGQGPDTCAQSTDALDFVLAVAVSDDGKSVYTASVLDDAIVRLKREP